MIQNGKDRTISQSAGNLPQLTSAVQGWFQPMVFSTVTKTVIAGLVSETEVQINFMGMSQPLTSEQLQQKPEGSRNFPWQMIHADPSLVLKLDDKVYWNGLMWRVLARTDWSQYGYVEYHIVQGYQGQ